MTPAELDTRAWLDELLARPHLWPWQAAQALALAEELGVAVKIYDRPLNGGEWRQRKEVLPDGAQ